MARKGIVILAVITGVVCARSTPSDAAPALRLHHIRIVDATTPGAPLRAAPLGVPVYVRVVLQNTGSTDATHVVARLDAPAFTVVSGELLYGTIAPGKTASRSFLATAARCPPNAVVASLRVTSDAASFRSSFTLPIVCPRVAAAPLAHTGPGGDAALPWAVMLLVMGIGMRRVA